MYLPLEIVLGMPNNFLNSSQCWSWLGHCWSWLGGGGGPKNFWCDSGGFGGDFGGGFGGDFDFGGGFGGDLDADAEFGSFGSSSDTFDSSISGLPEKPLLKQLNKKKTSLFEHPLCFSGLLV